MKVLDSSQLLSSTLSHLIFVVVLYGIFLNLILQEPIQSNLVYHHQFFKPTKTDFSDVSSLGFRPSQVHNFKLPSTDQVDLGVYHIVPDNVYQSKIQPQIGVTQPFDTPFYLDLIQSGISDVVLFLHDSGLDRKDSSLVPLYQKITKELNTHLIVFDYRGFGDSSGESNSKGMFKDSLMVFNHLVANNVYPSRIHIMGQGLGSNLALQLTKYLNEYLLYPKSLTLIEPNHHFEDRYQLNWKSSYNLLYPTNHFKQLDRWVQNKRNHRFDSDLDFEWNEIQTSTLILASTYDGNANHLNNKVFEKLSKGLITWSEHKPNQSRTVQVFHKGTTKLVSVTKLETKVNILEATNLSRQMETFWKRLEN